MITIDSLKKAQDKLGHVWFTNKPNIISIRTTLSVPDIFNDILCLVYFKDGKEVLKTYAITTEPGVYYQKKLLNPNGCAIIALGQYVDAYSIGFHQGKTDHKCLRQTGKINVIRDKDLNGIVGDSGSMFSGSDFGCNIHGANKLTRTEKIGAWSAGCQVFQNWKDKEEFITICESFKLACQNKFTYSLIKETDL